MTRVGYVIFWTAALTCAVWAWAMGFGFAPVEYPGADDMKALLALCFAIAAEVMFKADSDD